MSAHAVPPSVSTARRHLSFAATASWLLCAGAPSALALTGGHPIGRGFGSLGVFDNPGGLFPAQAIARHWAITAGHVAPEPGRSTWTGSDGARTVIAVRPLRLAPHDAPPPLPGLRSDDIALLQFAPSGTSAAPLPWPMLSADWPPRPGPEGTLPVTMVSPDREAHGHRAARGTVLGIEQRAGFGLLIVRGEDGATVAGGDSGSPLFEGSPASIVQGTTMLGVATALARGPGGTSAAVYLALAPYRSLIDAALATTGDRARWTPPR